MFSKRHYETIARVMQDTKPDGTFVTNQIRLDQWAHVRDKLACAFACDNGQFKQGRFIAACEPGANVRARS
jgi:hypothetical protein